MKRRRDTGFTLIETLIAMMVMSVAVIAIVAALAALIGQTQFHRGHSVTETGIRSFGQAVQASFGGGTALNDPSGVTSTDEVLIVTDASVLPVPRAGVAYFIAVGLETMRVVANDGASTVEVERGEGGTEAREHPDGAPVVPILLVQDTDPPAVGTGCPGTEDFAPAVNAYALDARATATVLRVAWWDADPDDDLDNNDVGAFSENASDCRAEAAKRCPGADDILPLCGPGLYRITVQITTPDADVDQRLRGVDTVTQLLVRRGSV